MSIENDPLREEEDQRLCEAIERAIEAQERAKTLSNEQLVKEILDQMPFGPWDELVEEACTRLDPDWSNRPAPPPTAEEQAMLERVHAKSMARLQKLLDER